jgi:hypothetical protein
MKDMETAGSWKLTRVDRNWRRSMEHVITWQERGSTTEEVQARSLVVFSRWSPDEGTTFLQCVPRIDGGGGSTVVEAEDPTLIARDRANFGANFEMGVPPARTSRRARPSPTRPAPSCNPSPRTRR